MIGAYWINTQPLIKEKRFTSHLGRSHVWPKLLTVGDALFHKMEVTVLSYWIICLKDKYTKKALREKDGLRTTA